MTSRRVLLTRTISHELTVTVYADDDTEAERLAINLAPPDSREWTVVNQEIEAKAEGGAS